MISMHVVRFISLFSLLAIPCTLPAASPCVQFDVASAIACQDVTPDEWSEVSTHDKLIRIQFQISSLIRLGREDSLLQYLYVISSTTRPFQVVDYEPKTTLHSDISGSLTFESKNSQGTNLSARADTLPLPMAGGDANASFNRNKQDSVRFEKLPAQQLLIASGTMHRGASAYFKLKPSSQTTLDGDREFEIIARVPIDWRGGLLHVRCAAFGQPKGISPAFSMPLGEEELVCGSRSYWVGIHQAGDDEARAAVNELLNSQHALQVTAQAQSQAITARRYASLGHKLGAAFSLAKPRIPDSWLEQILNQPSLPEFSRHLPRPVQVAAAEYVEARQNVLSLAGY